MKQLLTPSLDDLRLECVLMQAWKKTSTYLRAHSWYADTLEIDYESLRLPQFIREIQERLSQPEDWQSKPLELVPAPKKQRWAYNDEKWEPRETKIDLKLRPLAHVDLQDQVVATAIMLCLADRVETALGNPLMPINAAENRNMLLAYGHRLYCDRDNAGILRHRWGSSKLYRQYFQDYQSFLERSKIVAREIGEKNTDLEVAIVQSDLSKFYDRVRPWLLWEKLRKFQIGSHENAFFALAERVFDWRWSDKNRAGRYAKDHGIDEFGKVALPQGLVSAGFFANIVLYDFDAALRSTFGNTLPKSDLVLEDACYYVDDLRLVLSISRGTKEDDIKKSVITWMDGQLKLHAPGLKIADDEKTQVTVEGREERFLVRQSREADRIKSQLSGPFDMVHGTDLIAAIEGFFHTQQRYSTELDPDKKEEGRLLVGVPDMRDDTAARFAAGRFRRTYRSLRPLLADEELNTPESDGDSSAVAEYNRGVHPQRLVLSKNQLDERAKFFSALLIDEWIKNPGNVRLLRIALDLYPDHNFLAQVLKILRPGWASAKFRKAKREIRIYCLAELFRAGATETGIVKEDECLPDNLQTDEYHWVLVKEARELVEAYLGTPAPGSRFPWYLMQQVFLYLSARNALPAGIAANNARGGKLLARYWQFAKFMAGEMPASLEQRSIYLVIAKTGFGVSGFDFLSSITRLSDKFLIEVDRISPAVAGTLWLQYRDRASDQVKHAAHRLGLENHVAIKFEKTLAETAVPADNPFYEEENLLELARWLLSQPAEAFKAPVTPWRVFCEVEIPKPDGYEYGKIKPEFFDLRKSGDRAAHLFEPPDWCESAEDRQKLQIGLLLRFALRGSTSFYSNLDSKKFAKVVRYRKPISHWEQQRYSGFQGREAFGPQWLPISSFTEELLFQLLRWPGSGVLTEQSSIADLLTRVVTHLAKMRAQRGKVTSATFLEQSALWSKSSGQGEARKLRVGIVQSIIPNLNDYINHRTNPELNDPAFRRLRRAHLAAIMEGIAQMLRVRETHRPQSENGCGIVDLLIFPELAIHPQDIDSHILPFVRQYRCIALFGQVYHPRDEQTGSPLINSCLWMIPEWSAAQGLQIHRIEQGKQHLAAAETELSPQPVGFRPAQWLIQYQWHRDSVAHRPLVLSASICYDATDLELAADLRSMSDLYIVCALNRDVGTFDRMSEGLHYHMYQGVIVVNNGQFGGSNFYIPFENAFNRQVLHIHGQPQASISFVEISPQDLIDREGGRQSTLPEGQWKQPPAGWPGNRS
ncbi:MAG: RNA-directed DNA polymerase [Thermodesulfovibrionales bacterium]